MSERARRAARETRADGGDEERGASAPAGEATAAAPRITIESRRAPQRERDLAELRQALLRTPREIPSKHLYDERGSQLFERICELPEYYQTRTEKALLDRNADRIVAQTRIRELVEIGSGAATKTRVLLRAMERQGLLARYLPIDVDVAMLERVAAELTSEFPGLRVHGIGADFDHSLERLPRGPRRLVAFLGSTIGNLRPRDEAPELLRSIRSRMRAGDRFLLGVDLIKDRVRLEAAYNDASGVTAEFNRNILEVVNRLAGADFDPGAFRHLAFWDERNAWMDIRLVAGSAQRVHLRALDLEIEIARGEEIRTEISAKYDRPGAEALLAAGGFALEEWMTDDESLFALALARRARQA
ncbi:MAG TPA: L-histidine N(alpha)-methyltransferase [Thermoanaerobaculia bacterium]|nr:L-histidine N(alpha)-methyltransferase [Thermoanaerobaculia bacterium]